MGKIWLIIQREYLVRVRKKSFIIMTILGPLLMASLLIVPIYLANESQQERMIAISEDREGIAYKIEDSQYLHFTIIPNSEALEIKENFLEVILAKGFDKDSLQILKRKKNLRIIDISNFKLKNLTSIKSFDGSFLLQDKDNRYG